MTNTTLFTCGPANASVVQSFWTVIAFLCGLAAAALSAATIAGGGRAMVIGLATAVLIWSLALSAPGAARIGYRAWNWLARKCQSGANRLLLRLAFALAAAGRSESRLGLEREAATGSYWKPLEKRSPAVGVEAAPRGGWSASLSQFTRQAVRSGDLWALALAPTLAALALFRSEQDNEAPADIYTLF